MMHRPLSNGFVTAALANKADAKGSRLELPSVDPLLLKLYMREHHPELLSKDGEFKGYPKKVKPHTARHVKAKTEHQDGFYQAAQGNERDSINAVLSASTETDVSVRDNLDDFLMVRALDLAANVLIEKLQGSDASLKDIIYRRLHAEMETSFVRSNETDSPKRYADVVLGLHMQGHVDYSAYMACKDLSSEEFLVRFLNMIVDSIELIQGGLQEQGFQECAVPSKLETRSWGRNYPAMAYVNAVNKVAGCRHKEQKLEIT